MSSFSLMLMGEGVEVEIPGGLSDTVSLLDEEVRWFSYKGHEYQLTPTRTELGTRWDLAIRLINSKHREMPCPTVGRVELENLDGNGVVFRIPPRDADAPLETLQADPAGHFLGSFIFQSLNMLHRRKLIQLPGVLPTN